MSSPPNNNSSSATIDDAHLDWSNKQGRILTADGRAIEYFVAARGFPFEAHELPHHHLLQGDSCPTFRTWKNEPDSRMGAPSIVIGAWFRRYFVGGWEISTSIDEDTFNLQSKNLFVDMRIPTTRKSVLPSHVASLSDLSDLELRYFARQHVFCGYSRIGGANDSRPHCTRHHVLDWNFVGAPRPRPNKWHIESGNDTNKWKEWAFATDDNGQHYYCEQWERLKPYSHSQAKPRLALRTNTSQGGADEGILVVIGDHFQYCIGSLRLNECAKYPNAKSLVDVVDAAIAVGDRTTAESLCTRLDAGHGLRSSGWIVDTAILPWKEGTTFVDGGDIVVEGEGLVDETCCVIVKGVEWEIFDCSFDRIVDLRRFLQT